MSTLALLPTLALYNDAYLRSLAMFEDIGTRAVELLSEDSDLSDEVASTVTRSKNLAPMLIRSGGGEGRGKARV